MPIRVVPRTRACRFSSVMSRARPRIWGSSDASAAVTAGSIPIVSIEMPSNSAVSAASSRLCWLVKREGCTEIHRAKDNAQIAAYMAEAVRGGLQALPDGQTEAAEALGLGYWRIQRAIVLPQALRIALPAMTNEFIALFKNTTLVLIVSIFDLLGIAQAALADPAWVGMNMEAYVFAGAIYWFACFGLSQWSRSREKRLQKAFGR